MKLGLTILGLLMTILSYGQPGNDSIKVIAKLISPGIGSKIHIAEYKVIKVINGSLTNDTIKVGYYFYTAFQNPQDTVLLNLVNYQGPSIIKDYYIFPDYNARKGIEPVKSSMIQQITNLTKNK